MIVVFCNVLFFFNNSYILVSLMLIEFLSLNILIIYLLIYEGYIFNYWGLIYLLVFIVCDAVIGLSLLILIIRGYGHNYMRLIYFSI